MSSITEYKLLCQNINVTTRLDSSIGKQEQEKPRFEGKNFFETLRLQETAAIIFLHNLEK